MERKTSSASRKKCCVLTCRQKRGNDVRLFKFPNTETERTKWKRLCGIEGKSTKNLFICSNHFSVGCNNKKLPPNSVPSVNLPINDNCNNKNCVSIFNNIAPVDRLSTPNCYFVSDAHDPSLLKISNDSDFILFEKTSVLNTSSSDNSQNLHLPQLTCSSCEKSQKSIRFYMKKCSVLNRRIAVMKQNNKFLKSQVRNLSKSARSNNLSNQSSLHNPSVLSSNSAHNSPALSSSLPGTFNKTLNANVFSTLISKTKRTIYSQKEKELCQSIYFKSPSTYKFLKHCLNFHLPSYSSLLRWLPFKNIVPGFNTQVLSLIKPKIDQFDDFSKNAVLIFDEISIKKDLKYNMVHDQIEGFVDIGTRRENIFAKQVVVFMIRGLYKPWKFVINYFASEKGIPQDDLKYILFKNLELMHYLDLKITATTCDQGSNNRALYNNLGVSETNPFFTFKLNTGVTVRVGATYDICHLIKSARNSLLKHNFQFNFNQNSSNPSIASWSVIKELYLLEKNSVTKCCPKIKEAHIFPNNFQKMSVKYATQIFSNSVAAGIRTHFETQKFSDETAKLALDTAFFIENMNNLFDALNSKCLSSPNVMNSALQLNNRPTLFLQSMIDFVKNIKVLSPSSIYWQSGLIQTITIILSLLNELRENFNAKFLLTSRFNQDAIENLFALVRSHGGNNSTPSLSEFNFIISKLMSMRILFSSTNSNCENDDDEFIDIDWNVVINNSPTDSPLQNSSSTENQILPRDNRSNVELISSDIDLEDADCDRDFINIEDIASRRYFAGFVLYSHNSHMTDNSELLIRFKNYSVSTRSDFGSLLNPSLDFLKIFNTQFVGPLMCLTKIFIYAGSLILLQNKNAPFYKFNKFQFINNFKNS